MTQGAAAPDAAVPAPRAAGFGHGLSAEVRRFSAGIRAVIALLCSLLTFASDPAPPWGAACALVAYALWAGCLLWAEAHGRSFRRTLWHYWIDVAWTFVTLHATDAGSQVFAVTLVQPVVLASIAHGVRQGLVLALVSAVGLLLDSQAGVATPLTEPWMRAGPALGVLVLVPVAALLARPINVQRQRLALLTALGTQLDPRRGLDGLAGSLVEALRAGTGAHLSALVLPAATGAPMMIATADEGSFRAAADVQQRFETLLIPLPSCPVGYSQRRWAGLAGGVHVHDRVQNIAELEPRLAELASQLDVAALAAVPIMRYGRVHGQLLIGYTDPGGHRQDIAALWHAAPELFRLIEQAALVDQLQEESAAHERSRIGRDLHDSAIQPYLGLKYAVESVAVRIAEDNPARVEVQSLVELVNGEVDALRELISGLRTGEAKGDNALVPALRRQVRRFALLFNIEVELDCPEQLPTSRALAGAVFHMVNEAMNNVRKHTPARRIWIAIAEREGRIALRVRDDAHVVLGHPVPMYSPRSLTERVEALGGEILVVRPDGPALELAINIPARAV